MLQVVPSRFFSAVPAFGEIPPESSVDVQLQFTPHSTDADLASRTINGYVRLRSIDGFPLERISLSACNGHLLRLYDSRVDFGFCPVRPSHLSLL